MPDLPLLEELATDRYLCAQVGVRPWEVVRGGALRGKFCSGICNFIARNAYVTGYLPYLDRQARKEQGGCGFVDVAEEGGSVRVTRAWDGVQSCLVVDT